MRCRAVLRRRAYIPVWMLLVAVRLVAGSGLGDFDSDNDIDLRDVAGLQVCFSGSAAADSECGVFRFDVDSDVDLVDYAAFHGSFAGPGALAPVLTDSALIVGKVFHAATGEPLEGASIIARFYPAAPGAPPLPPAATSGPDGSFSYLTVPIQGQATFLVQIFKTGFSESLRQVTVIAGRCWAVPDAHLTPINPPVMIMAEQGGTIQDLASGVTLEIPPGALMQDSNIGVTMLPSAETLRDELPQLVAAQGTFVDISGVFGDQTTTPVTMRIPNQYNLPLGTQVRFGKIDHNTLQWMDLTTAFGGAGNFGIGTVVSVPGGGTAIQVQFDHFCSICTGYCLPFPTPLGPPPTPPPPPPPDGCPDNGTGPFQSGSSTVDKREGFLWEDIKLPTFREFDRPWGVRLVYFSGAAEPAVTVRGHIDYNSTRPVERTIFKFRVEGLQVSAAYDFSQNNQKHHASWFWNGRNVLGELLPTGTYPYTVRATSLNANAHVALSAVFGGPATTTFTNLSYPGLTPLASSTLAERAALVNYVDSPFGAGWAVAEEHRLYLDPDGCVLLVSDAARPRLYMPRANPPGSYQSPPGDFSTLTRNLTDFTFVRALSDGTEYHFAASGLLDHIVDRYGYVTAFAYQDGLLMGITSPTGYSYAFEYGSGRLTRLSDSAGRQTLFNVDTDGNLVAVTDAVGSTRTFAYDTQHRLISQTGPRGERSEYTYTNGRVTQTHAFDVDGTTLLRARVFAPSALNGEAGAALAAGLGTLQDPIPLVAERIDIYIDGRGAEWRDTTSGDGKTITYRDPLNRTTTLVHDDNGLLVSRVRPNGSEVAIEYDDAGSVVLRREVSDGSELQLEYEGPFQQLSRFVDELGRETVLSYSANGNLIELAEAEGRTTTFFYENPALPHMPTRVVDALGGSMQFARDAHGQILSRTDPLLRMETAAYDAAGNRTRFTNAQLAATFYSYDALNRLTSVLDAINAITELTYSESACGCSSANLTGVTLPNGTMLSFAYDGLNRRIQSVDQLGQSSTETYDAEGARLSWLNRNNELITYEYDAAGQLVHKLLPDGTDTMYSYDSLGNLAAVTNPQAELSFAYDARGRQTLAIQTSLATGPPGTGVPATHVWEFTYDAAGNRLTMTDASGMTSYAYDGLDRTVSLADPIQNAWSFVHDPLRLREIHRPNLTVTALDFDAAGQMLQIEHRSDAGVPWLTFTYDVYDALGNVTAQTALFGSDAQQSLFSYDALQRLATAMFPPVPQSMLLDNALAFDAANRILSDGSATYEHDAEGRRISRHENGSPLTTSYQYDAEGRLVHVLQQLDDDSTVLDATYAYDGTGRRVTKDVNGVMTHYVYDGLDLLYELDADHNVVRRYTMGPGLDQPLAVSRIAGDQVLHYHADRAGSIAALSDGFGDVVQRYTYDAFGAIVARSAMDVVQPLAFTARELDAEGNLYAYRSRFYDPDVGRFITEDPWGLQGGDLNFYAYVGNNPVNRTDPLGLYNLGIPPLRPPALGPLPGVPAPPPSGPQLIPPLLPPPPGPFNFPICFGPVCIPGGVRIPGGGSLSPTFDPPGLQCTFGFTWP